MRLCLWLLVIWLLPTAAAAGDPKVPSGRDPGGVAVAMFTTGIDYMRAELARVLARDGEGELIGWDFVDGDQRPYVADDPRDGTLASMIGADAGARIVPVRVSLSEPGSLARAIGFVARTDARIVVVPMESGSAKDWEAFAAAARHFSGLLFVLATADGTGFPARMKLENAIAISNGAAAEVSLPARDPATAAAEAVRRLLVCGDRLLQGASGAQMKRDFLVQLSHPPGGAKALAPACDSQGAGQGKR